MDPAPEWIGNAYILKDILSEENGLTEEKFRQFLLHQDVPRTCEHIHALNIPPRKSPFAPFGSQLLKDFCHYLESMMIVFFDSKREQFIEIMMEYHLPFDLYLYLSVGFNRWIDESRTNLFRLYFAQGYTMQMLKGKVEREIAVSGNVDVLDFFLSLETPESGHVLDHNIVTHVCKSKNVDMLDRLINKGYPMNEGYDVEIIGKIVPIYYSFDSRYDETDILDRLIMAGADVNPHTRVDAPRRTSVLYFALRAEAMKCFQRLLDVGAQVRNDVDTEIYFATSDFKRETMIPLIQAGMDLNYRTGMGTPLEIVTERYFAGAKREEAIALVREFGGR
jgi:hypothetical protein